MTTVLSMSRAEEQDAGQIAALLNTAYRGESSKQGWTTEADLLAGRRTDTEEVLRLILSDDSLFLLGKTKTELIGSVHLQKQAEQLCLGMLAVSPPLQGKGIGKQLLFAAEQAAQELWGVNKSVMSVVSCRNELIAYYQRRGYRRTGVSKAFPVNRELWTPKVADLRLEILEKILSI
ncbi:MAG: GNAT family N-acetyltransferase [Methylovulum sp.]|nr:GNAT family N-acetyltransferase [Methylovulum sp.]